MPMIVRYGVLVGSIVGLLSSPALRHDSDVHDVTLDYLCCHWPLNIVLLLCTNRAVRLEYTYSVFNCCSR